MMPATRAVVTSEAPAAPILLTLYGEAGPAGRIELPPKAALQLAADLLNHALTKRNIVMGHSDKRRWEALINAARELNHTDTPTPEGVLPELLAAFDTATPADLPAFAVMEFLRALQAPTHTYPEQRHADDAWDD